MMHFQVTRKHLELAAEDVIQRAQDTFYPEQVPAYHSKARLMYAIESLCVPQAWKNWEVFKTTGTGWVDLKGEPEWSEFNQYRRKDSANTICVNGYEIPQPLKEFPEIGVIVYAPDILNGGGRMTWAMMIVETKPDDELHHYLQRLLQLGLMHATEEAAMLHAKALLNTRS